MSEAKTKQQPTTLEDAGPEVTRATPNDATKAGLGGRGGSGGVAGAAMHEAGRAAPIAGAAGDARALPDAGEPHKDGDAEPEAPKGMPQTMPTAPGSAPPPMATRCSAIDKLDLLLMVDNSNSMAAEQTSLKQAFPKLIEALTSGLRFPGDPQPFPPVKDLHVGVVSSDMGIPGVEFPPTCHAEGGDDGRLLHKSNGQGCELGYPQWLQFQNTGQDVAKFALDMGCISNLGTGGCGIEQQLESTLKALWPRHYKDLGGNEIPNPITFLSTTVEGSQGRGDAPEAEGGNLGFLRTATDESPSLLVIIAVTDEDDCSVKSTEHLKPASQLTQDSPYISQDINLRCHYNPQFLYNVEARYFKGLRMLRPNLEDRVMFAAIAGIPTELVDADALEQVDFDAADPISRKTFYDGILADNRMQEVIDPATMAGSGTGNLTPSCKRMIDGEMQPSTAYPPRRIVELAKLFDQNGMVQSICQDDFTQPISAITQMIGRKLAHPCGASSP